MPQHYSGDAISMRHLPDVSDTSFSFQIPGSAPYDNLLAEDDQDFFRGVDVSEITPNPPPTHANEPLTLRELTPRPTTKKTAPHDQKRPSISSPTLSYPQHQAEAPIPDTKFQKPVTRAHRPEGSRPSSRKSVAQPRPRLVTPTLSLPCPPSVEQSPVGARFEGMKAEVDLLAQHLPAQPSTAEQEIDKAETCVPNGSTRPSLEKKKLYSREERREKRSRIKQELFEGEIIKRKAISKSIEKTISLPAVNSSTNTNPDLSPPEPSILSKDPNGDDESTADTTMSSTSTGGGVAARLVHYSHKLINSFGLPNSASIANMNVHQRLQASSPWDPDTGTDESNEHPQNNIDSNQPLTLSQLSPRKRSFPSPTPNPPVSVPMSPVRSSSKRPAASLESEVQRKKSKTEASTAGGKPTVSQSSEMNVDTKLHHALTRKHPISAVSGPSRLKSAKVDKGISRTKANGKPIARQAPAFKPRSTETLTSDEIRHASKSISSSASGSSTSKLRISRQRTDHTIEPVNSLSLKGKSKMSSSSSRSTAKPEFYIPNIPLQATKPVAFHLSTDARSQSRRSHHDKDEGSSQSQSRSQKERDRKHHAPIPDFKALHAAQEAKLALRKENIHPTVPLPIKWETDHRVKERQKFDEMVREKEREQERLMEERRREREEQEERELRELRKKAIPKAHEVPEWYKEAPKKKDKTIGPNGS